MSDYLKSFLNPNGTTSWQGQVNAGTHEFNSGFKPAGQQPHESADAYNTRVNQHNWLNNGGNGK